MEQLKRILYYNPLNKKFVITNFSESLTDFMAFEEQVCPINKVVTFSKEATTINNPFILYLNNKTQFETDLRTFFQNIDKDNSGSIDFNEYMAYMTQISGQIEADLADQDSMRESLDKIDLNKDGVVDMYEFRIMATNLLKYSASLVRL